MSKEGESLQKPTEEQLRADLLDYLKDAKVGTPKHIALNDSLAQVEFQNEYRYRLDQLDSLLEEGNPNRLKSWESSMRTNELDRALLIQDIRNHESTIPGYRLAFGRIQGAFEKFDMETIYDVALKVLKAPENNT